MNVFATSYYYCTKHCKYLIIVSKCSLECAQVLLPLRMNEKKNGPKTVKKQPKIVIFT